MQINQTYSHRKYAGIVPYVTKYPENKRSGDIETGPMNTAVYKQTSVIN